ncbi:hypothetical protein F2Q68_00009857 [Brassica cretica]|uniref:Replication factor A C-terminal domain-containing protein n=1 Tax=Brassica cretica TaxID=69181 RepID=A0A8S9KZ43_BRACR|nr:hypothetical protein F2Q68_00009857 [Brassica cretica]
MIIRLTGLGLLFDGLCGWVKSIPNMSPPASLVIPEGSSESEEARNEDFSSLTTNSDHTTKTVTLALSSVSSSRVFMDYDIQPTIDYFNCFTPVTGKVTKAETMNIREIFAYIKQESAKCYSSWYHIACNDCKTKATRGPSSLMCPKCGNNNVISVAQYLAKISVYDNNDRAVFALLGDAGRE